MSTDDIQYYSAHTYSSEYGGNVYAFRRMKIVTIYGIGLGSVTAPPKNTDWIIQTLDERYRPIYSARCLGLTSGTLLYNNIVGVDINPSGLISTYRYDLYNDFVLSFCASYIAN